MKSSLQNIKGKRNDMEKLNINRTHYINESYDSKERFNSYWHQILEINLCQASSILEIGKGNGFLCEYLKTRNHNITTCDIDPTLNPDIIGSVLSLPCSPNAYDLVVCFQVLEHLKYEFFEKTLRQLFRVTSNRAIISLPDVEKYYRFLIYIPHGIKLKKYLVVPCKKPKVQIFAGEHYWEIGKRGYSLERIYNDIRSAGFFIERTYRVFENPYHRFFILNKSNSYRGKLIYKPSKIRLGNMEDWKDEFMEENFNFKNLYLKLKKLLKLN